MKFLLTRRCPVNKKKRNHYFIKLDHHKRNQEYKQTLNFIFTILFRY